MSFNSVLFIFGFLPATVIGYYSIALSRLHWFRLPFLILATATFYARGSSQFLILLVASVAANYAVGTLIAGSKGFLERFWLWIGVAGNLAVLLWFKYAIFVASNLNMIFDSDFKVEQVALPLGISFYTFQQIAFLVDTSRRQFEKPGLINYFAFVLFFPQLLAGPISLAREIVPQMKIRPIWSSVPANILIGLTIFGLGMFKKTVVADTAALWATPIFQGAAAGASPAALVAWGGALAYTLQIYFDFSGYSDMAIGIARMFGILLPLNFHSPLRSKSIIDLWRRWHITLGRFVQTYFFQPIAVPLARFCSDRGLGDGVSVAVSILLPTFLALVIIGAWHGGNWTFVLFGAMHGSFMVINEAWNYLTKKRRKGHIIPHWRKVLAGALTLLAFVIAAVPFRSADVTTAMRVWTGMAGFNLGPDAWNEWPVLTPLGAWGLYPLIGLGFLCVYFLPNTQQIMARITPALEWSKWRKVDPAIFGFEWRPTVSWSIAGGAVLMIGIIFVARGSTQFVYFAF
jgi:alginate O-acetyltransferase complex protein AlgI